MIRAVAVSVLKAVPLDVVPELHEFVSLVSLASLGSLADDLLFQMEASVALKRLVDWFEAIATFCEVFTSMKRGMSSQLTNMVQLRHG